MLGKGTKRNINIYNHKKIKLKIQKQKKNTITKKIHKKKKIIRRDKLNQLHTSYRTIMYFY